MMEVSHVGSILSHNFPYMKLSERLADNLRRRRGSRTQYSFAKKLGLSKSTYNRLESCSQNTTLETLEQLTKSLKCDVGDLFD